MIKKAMNKNLNFEEYTVRGDFIIPSKQKEFSIREGCNTLENMTGADVWDSKKIKRNSFDF